MSASPWPLHSIGRFDGILCQITGHGHGLCYWLDGRDVTFDDYIDYVHIHGVNDAAQDKLTRLGLWDNSGPKRAPVDLMEKLWTAGLG